MRVCDKLQPMCNWLLLLLVFLLRPLPRDGSLLDKLPVHHVQHFQLSNLPEHDLLFGLHSELSFDR